MTDLRMFDPTKVRALFEEKDARIEALQAECDQLRAAVGSSGATVLAAPVEDHEIREAVSRLVDVAKRFNAAEQLRARIQDIVLPLLERSRAVAAVGQWTLTGPDGRSSSGATRYEALNVATRALHAERTPEQVAAATAALADLQGKHEADMRSMEELNCPACGGSGHVDDARALAASHPPSTIAHAAQQLLAAVRAEDALVDQLKVDGNEPDPDEFSPKLDAAEALRLSCMRALDAALAAAAAPVAQPSRDEMMLMAEKAGVAPNTIQHFEAAFLRFADLLAKRVAALSTVDAPAQRLKRGTTGICSRSTCECETQGLGDECIWLRPVEAPAQPPDIDSVIDAYTAATGGPEHFDAHELNRAIKAHPAHREALLRYAVVQLTSQRATPEEIEAEDDLSSPPSAVQASQQVGAVEAWREGRDAAAAYLLKKRDDFCHEFGLTDPGTGTLEFGRGARAEAQEQWVNDLEELADAIRALCPPDAPAEGPSAPPAQQVAAEPAHEFKQPDWSHVFAAFVDGAREARANPDAGDDIFHRAADGYTKRVFEKLDPDGERRLRENDWESIRPRAQPAASLRDGPHGSEFVDDTPLETTEAEAQPWKPSDGYLGGVLDGSDRTTSGAIGQP